MKRPSIGFAGMTHLGINHAVAAAEKGFNAICYDSDLDRINLLKSGQNPIREPNLDELLKKNVSRIIFSSDINCLNDCGVVYIAADVPTDETSSSDLTPIQKLIHDTQQVLSPDAAQVILSQVPPGFTRSFSTVRKHLYYQVETLIFGRAVERALFPERIIVGCANPKESIFAPLAEFLSNFNCPILPMKYESAELAKISINIYLAAAISVANTLANLCEWIGADWSEIIPALKLDKRIGQYAYLKPGLGIAGGNLERDLKTVCELANCYGVDVSVIQAFVANSKYRRDWVLRILHQEVLSVCDNPIIAVLGLTYKPDTDSTKNSPSMELLKDLESYCTRTYDPAISNSNIKSVLEACEGADVVLVMTPWPQFSEIDVNEMAKRMRQKIILDPYAVFSTEKCCVAGFRHLTLGCSIKGNK